MEPCVIDCHTHTRDHIYIYTLLLYVLSVCTSCIPAINLGRLQMHALDVTGFNTSISVFGEEVHVHCFDGRGLKIEMLNLPSVLFID